MNLTMTISLGQSIGARTHLLAAAGLGACAGSGLSSPAGAWRTTRDGYNRVCF
jgi:hypothetical protein